MSQEEIDKNIENVLENIRRIRVDKGISIINLANLAEISHSYIYYIESKQKIPTLTTLFKLAEALNVDIGDFFE
ncbi:MAG: helix-turn-helix domain-containing protein [Eubacteriales bacterium]